MKKQLGKRGFLILILLFFLAFVAVGCGQQGAGSEEGPEGIAVELAAVTRGDIQEKGKISSTVVPKVEVNLVAPVPGRVAQVNVKVGDRVRAGQTVLQLESEDAQARVRQAEAALKLAQVNLEAAPSRLEQARLAVSQAKANFENARANRERMEFLFKEGAISKQQWEQAQLQYLAAEVAFKSAEEGLVQAEKGVATAEAQLSQAEAALSQAKVALAYTSLKAPISGVVSARMVDPGEMAQGPVLTIVALDPAVVELGVTESDISYFQKGKAVEVEVPVLGKNFSGKVSEVSPATDPRTKNYLVRVEVSNPEETIKAGMAANVTFARAQAENVVLVPKQAVVSRGGEFVFTVENGQAVSRPVTTGIADENYVEIKTGLAEGEEIVVKGQEYLEDGRPVRVVARRSPA